MDEPNWTEVELPTREGSHCRGILKVAGSSNDHTEADGDIKVNGEGDITKETEG